MTTLNALIRYGKISDENYNKLCTWFSEGIEQIAEGKGQILVSASGASQSFSYAQNITINDWVAVLDMAIRCIDSGLSQMPNTVYKRF